MVRIALLDAEGREIGHQMLTVPGPAIEPGAVLGFATLAPDPQAQVADIGVAFDLTARPQPPPAAVPPPDASVQFRPEPILRGPVGLETPEEAVEAEPLDTLPREALSASHG